MANPLPILISQLHVKNRHLNPARLHFVIDVERRWRQHLFALVVVLHVAITVATFKLASGVSKLAYERTLSIIFEEDNMDRKLTQTEINQSIEHTTLEPILTPNEAAAMLRLKVSTLYRHVSEGRYSGSVKRGKPLRFWRDRLIQEFMQ